MSADSSGSVQFWDSTHGTLLQAHSCHKGDVNALAASPSHTRVFSAGSDGQVCPKILYLVVFMMELMIFFLFRLYYIKRQPQLERSGCMLVM